MGIHMDIGVGGDIIDHRVGHVGEHLTGDFLPGQHIVAARAAEAVAVDADGDGFVFAQLVPLKDDGGHALADRLAHVDGVINAGEEIGTITIGGVVQKISAVEDLDLKAGSTLSVRLSRRIGGGIIDGNVPLYR